MVKGPLGSRPTYSARRIEKLELIRFIEALRDAPSQNAQHVVDLIPESAAGGSWARFGSVCRIVCPSISQREIFERGPSYSARLVEKLELLR